MTQAPDARDRMTLRGRSVAVARAGDSGDRAILAYGVDGLTVRRGLFDALAADRRVAAPDFFGVGASDPPPDDQAPILIHDAAILAELLAETDAPAHLIGHGMGAAAAARAALDHPARIASLTLIEPFVLALLEDSADPRRVEALEVAWAVTTLVAFGEEEKAASAWAGFWRGPGAYEGMDPEGQAYARATVARAAAELKAASRNAPGALRYDELGDFDAPTHLLCGDAARASIRAATSRFRSALPHAQYTELAAAGAAARAARAIIAFIDQHPSDRGV